MTCVPGPYKSCQGLWLQGGHSVNGSAFDSEQQPQPEPLNEFLSCSFSNWHSASTTCSCSRGLFNHVVLGEPGLWEALVAKKQWAWGPAASLRPRSEPEAQRSSQLPSLCSNHSSSLCQALPSQGSWEGHHVGSWGNLWLGVGETVLGMRLREDTSLLSKPRDSVLPPCGLGFRREFSSCPWSHTPPAEGTHPSGTEGDALPCALGFPQSQAPSPSSGTGLQDRPQSLQSQVCARLSFLSVLLSAPVDKSVLSYVAVWMY